MNTPENQPPTTAEIVKELRAIDLPGDCIYALDLAQEAADRLEAQERELQELRADRERLGFLAMHGMGWRSVLPQLHM